MNNITIVGRVGKDPELNSSKTVARFSVAVDRRVKGEKVTDWFTVKTFGKSAEFVEEYVAKGRQLAVSGSMVNDAYEKDGQKRDFWCIEASRVELVGSKDEQGGSRRKDDDSDW